MEEQPSRGVDPASLPMPARLGRYEVVKVLGRGAWGEVFACHDPLLDRHLAVKILRQNVSGDIQKILGRFQTELRVLGRLHHPNIIAVYDAGLEDGRPYLAMELCRGPCLLRLLAAIKPFSPAQALWVIERLAAALDHIHARGIVHRDIKPSNLIFHAGELKLTDFGVVHVEENQLTAAGDAVGTPAFMAPEQVLGEKVDHRADLYAMGVLMFNLLAGRGPFLGPPLTVMYQVVHKQAPPLSWIVQGVPPALDAVLAKALARNAADRFETAAAFVAALREAMPGIEPIAPVIPDALVDHSEYPRSSSELSLGSLLDASRSCRTGGDLSGGATGEEAPGRPPAGMLEAPLFGGAAAHYSSPAPGAAVGPAPGAAVGPAPRPSPPAVTGPARPAPGPDSIFGGLNLEEEGTLEKAAPVQGGAPPVIHPSAATPEAASSPTWNSAAPAPGVAAPGRTSRRRSGPIVAVAALFLLVALGAAGYLARDELRPRLLGGGRATAVVESIPPGATIKLGDGTALGVTPLQAPVTLNEAGRVALFAHKEGWLPQGPIEKEGRAGASISFIFVLEPLAGSEPAGTDGAGSEAGRSEAGGVAPGSAAVSSGRRARASSASRRAVPSEVGYLLVDSSPAASISVDGRPLGRTGTGERFAVPIGQHVVLLRTIEGERAVVVREVEIKKGETRALEYDFIERAWRVRQQRPF